MMNNDQLIKMLRDQLTAARATAAQLERSREASIVQRSLDDAQLWAGEIAGTFGPSSGTLK